MKTSDDRSKRHVVLHETGVGLFLVDLVADIVDVGREVVLGVVVNYVTDVREDKV